MRAADSSAPVDRTARSNTCVTIPACDRLRVATQARCRACASCAGAGGDHVAGLLPSASRERANPCLSSGRSSAETAFRATVGEMRATSEPDAPWRASPTMGRPPGERVAIRLFSTPMRSYLARLVRSVLRCARLRRLKRAFRNHRLRVNTRMLGRHRRKNPACQDRQLVHFPMSRQPVPSRSGSLLRDRVAVRETTTSARNLETSIAVRILLRTRGVALRLAQLARCCLVSSFSAHPRRSVECRTRAWQAAVARPRRANPAAGRPRPAPVLQRDDPGRNVFAFNVQMRSRATCATARRRRPCFVGSPAARARPATHSCRRECGLRARAARKSRSLRGFACRLAGARRERSSLGSSPRLRAMPLPPCASTGGGRAATTLAKTRAASFAIAVAQTLSKCALLAQSPVRRAAWRAPGELDCVRMLPVRPCARGLRLGMLSVVTGSARSWHVCRNILVSRWRRRKAGHRAESKPLSTAPRTDTIASFSSLACSDFRLHFAACDAISAPWRGQPRTRGAPAAPGNDVGMSAALHAIRRRCCVGHVLDSCAALRRVPIDSAAIRSRCLRLRPPPAAQTR